MPFERFGDLIPLLGELLAHALLAELLDFVA